MIKELRTYIGEDTLKQVMLLVGVWGICFLLGRVVVDAILQTVGVSDLSLFIEEVKAGEKDEYLNVLKIVLGTTNLCSYILPAVITAYLLFTPQTTQKLFLKSTIKPLNLILVLAITVVSMPAISFIYYYNALIIPEAWVAQDTLEIEQRLMEMNSPKDLILNLGVFGLIAGVGEELFFRGLLQRFLTKLTKHIHVAALVTGLLFTLMHFQLEGFVPRLILSLFFSYFLIYTANLWVTIIIHALYNSIQVVVYYIDPTAISKVNEFEQVSVWNALGSFGLAIILWYLFIKRNQDYNYIDVE